MLRECRCDTCFMGHFEGRIQWKHSFIRLTQLEVKVRSRPGQIMLHLQTQNFHSEACLSCPVLPQDSKNDFLFGCTTIKNDRKLYLKNIKKMSRPYSETAALRSNSFSMRDVLVICNRVILKPLTLLH